MKLVFCPWAVVESVANGALQYARAVAAGEVHRRARGQIYRGATGKNRHSLVFMVNDRRLELLFVPIVFRPAPIMSKLEPRWWWWGFTRGSHTCIYIYSNVNTRMYTKHARGSTTWRRDARVVRNTFKAWGHIGVYMYYTLKAFVTLLKMVYIFIIWGEGGEGGLPDCDTGSWLHFVLISIVSSSEFSITIVHCFWYCACPFLNIFFFLTEYRCIRVSWTDDLIYIFWLFSRIKEILITIRY